MIGCAACDNINVLNVTDFIFRKVNAVKLYGLAFHHAGSHGCFNCGGLLADFLKHEVLIAALFRCIRIPCNMFYRRLNLFAVHVIDFDGIFLYYGELFVFKVDKIPCVVKHGRDVRSNIIFIFANTYDKWAIFSDGDDFVWLA